MRGLFMTSFLADDFLADQDYHGARSVLISSASSKTSIALAFQLKQGGRARAIGLTSARNAEFVRGLGFYDQVVLYDEIASLAQAAGGVRGHGRRRRRHRGRAPPLRRRARSTTARSARRTGRRSATNAGLPGPKPQFFFAPAQIVKRSKDWGPQGLSQRIGAAWTKFCDASDAWLHVVRSSGRDALERVYQDTLAGRTHPADGHILSL